MRWSLFLLLGICVAPALAAEQGSWKAGLGKAVITPKQSMWLAGYGNRDRPSEGTLHDLWIKALALEDANGYKVVLLTSDLCGMPKYMYDSICATLKKSHGLEREQIRLCNSHNHCAPAVRADLEDYYPLNDEQRKRVYDYSDWLEQEIVKTIDRALAELKPVTLSAGEGLCTFAVNRRNNREAEVPAIYARGDKPKGPVDHSVPVIAVKGEDGKLVAVVFAYACHNTVLNFYQWCGDYAGFAQIALEKAHPGTQTLFVCGCGGDQNPLPRRTVQLAEKYGNELAAAVDKVLAGPMRPLVSKIRASFTFVTLDFDAIPTRAELEKLANGPVNLRHRWARRFLKQLDEGKSLAKSYPYAVQVWKLGDQLWIAMGGETLVDYAIRFKKQFGERTWVTSYAHDLTAYIPSLRNWEEGGYESINLYEYMHPAARWKRDLEERIAEAMNRMVKKVNE
jgi:hypothetical protein